MNNRTASLGLDLGTNSVRALVVETATGREMGTCVAEFERGDAGVILDASEPLLARQHPAEWLPAIEDAARVALADSAVRPADLAGIGVDATASTPLPLDAEGNALALDARRADHPAALAWLWKDHTAHAEAAEITRIAAEMRPNYLAKCGGAYSAEWFWSKILHCARTAPDVFAAARTWVECADWIPAVLCGTTRPGLMKRGICGAGHKGLFHAAWGGWPDEDFLARLDPRLPALRRTLPPTTHPIGERAGTLSPEWAARLGLRPGIPVAVGAIDAHLGAVGAGIAPGVLVRIMGTSACDIMLAPLEGNLPDIPGLCGIVPESVLPGFLGLEAGQAAVGDIYNWFVHFLGGASHEELTRAADALRPGASGLLALDWHNGNRSVLADQRLTGALVGMTLHTTAPEMFRAFVEATAFGARMIVERFEEHGLRVERVRACGGIAAKNPLVMQIHADVLNRPIEVSRSAQTCALGAAMAGAVVGGAHADFAAATAAMTGVVGGRYEPQPEAAAVYERLFALYRRLHDAFGVRSQAAELHSVMKELLAMRDAARS